MRAIAIVACLVLLASGCVSYRASKITALTGVAAVVGAIVLGATAVHGRPAPATPSAARASALP